MDIPEARLSILEKTGSQDVRDLCAEVRRLRQLLAGGIDLVADLSKSVHDGYQLASKGHLHPGGRATCEAMSCESARDFVSAAQNALPN